MFGNYRSQVILKIYVQNQQKCDILSHKLYKLYLLNTQVVNTIQGIKSFLYRLLLLYKDRIILQDEGRRTIREH